MFQTLKPGRTETGHRGYVVQSVMRPHDRKARKFPACGFCKSRKLKCILDEKSGECDQCHRHEINCSHQRAADSTKAQAQPSRESVSSTGNRTRDQSNTQSTASSTNPMGSTSNQYNHVAPELEYLDDGSANTELDLAWPSYTTATDTHDELAEFLNDNVDDTSDEVISDDPTVRLDDTAVHNNPENTTCNGAWVTQSRAMRETQQAPEKTFPRVSNTTRAKTPCSCIEYIVQTNETIHIRLVWPPVSYYKYRDEIDDTLQCLKDILSCLETFLACSRCRTRSEYIMSTIPMCREIIKTIGKLYSSLPATGKTKTSMMKICARDKAIPAHLTDVVNSSEFVKRDTLTTSSSRFNDEEELQATWHLIHLRTARVGRLLQYIEKITQTNRLPCLPAVRRMRAGVRDCFLAVNATH